VGVDMPRLLGGEFKLLVYLGRYSFEWHSCCRLCAEVYERDDAAARQLVWTYASTLRKKLAPALPALVETCRRLGYRCRSSITVVNEDASDEEVVQSVSMEVADDFQRPLPLPPRIDAGRAQSRFDVAAR
jgi:hypothetical protein